MSSPASLPPRAGINRFWLWLVAAIGVMIAWMVYVYHGGENSYILIWDCLDSNVPLSSVLAKSDVFFGGSDAVFEPLLGGIPRNCVPSETNLNVLPYRFLSAFHAFVFCEFVVRTVALLGMVLLLKRHLLPKTHDFVICGTALCFALLPFYPCSGLTSAGQPLLLYAILNLRNRNCAVYNWLIIGLFPFVSSLILIGIFLIPLLAIYVAYECVVRRKAALPLLAAWCLLTAGYALAEYRLLIQVLGTKNFVSFRTEFGWHHQSSFMTAVKDGALNFVFGQFHVESLQYPIILVASLLATASWLFWRSRGKTSSTDGEHSPNSTAESPAVDEAVGLAAAFVCCGLISLCYGLFDWSFTGRVIESTGIKLLRTVQFQAHSLAAPVLLEPCFRLCTCAAFQTITRRRPGRGLVHRLAGRHRGAGELRIGRQARGLHAWRPAAPDHVQAILFGAVVRADQELHRQTAAAISGRQSGHLSRGFDV